MENKEGSDTLSRQTKVYGLRIKERFRGSPYVLRGGAATVGVSE